MPTINPIWDGLRSNPGSRSVRAAADRLSYTTTSTFTIHTPHTTGKVLTWQWCRYHDETRECVALLALNSSELTSGYLALHKELNKGVICGCGGTGHTVLLYFQICRDRNWSEKSGVLIAVTRTRQVIWDVAHYHSTQHSSHRTHSLRQRTPDLQPTATSGRYTALL